MLTEENCKAIRYSAPKLNNKALLEYYRIIESSNGSDISEPGWSTLMFVRDEILRRMDEKYNGPEYSNWTI